MARVSRRRAIVGVAALASGVSGSPVVAQQDSLAKIDPQFFAGEHNATLSRLSQALQDTPPLSLEGFRRIVGLLRDLQIITPAEAVILVALGEAIYRAQTVDGLRQAIDAAIAKLDATVGAVTKIIVNIARRSFDYATGQNRTVSIQRLLFIVASDVTGAVAGASAAAKLGSGVLIAAAVVAGAAASSLSGIYQTREATLTLMPSK